MDAVLVALPALLFSSLSALPVALGIIAAVRHLRAGSRPAYLRHLGASIAAGAVALALLWSSLFGDNLSSSSTAALIFAVVPFYAAIAQGIVYGIAAAVFRKSATPRAISLLARVALLIPLLLLSLLMFGLVKSAAKGSDSAVAGRGSDSEALHRLYEKSRTGEADSFAIPLNLAQNPDAPPELLSKMATHDHPAVRAQVARNPGTPQHVVAALRYDCASFVRKIVVERLGPVLAPQAPPAPTGVCALERWR
jgi:hypothetical protein